MSKKQWVLAILLIIGLSYLLINKIFPDVGIGIDQLVGPTVSGFSAGIFTAITTNPYWVSYWGYIGLATGAIIGALLVYRGRDAYDSLRGIARVQAKTPTTGGFSFQAGPTAQPVPIPQQPTVVQPQPVPTPQPQPPVQEQPKQ